MAHYFLGVAHAALTLTIGAFLVPILMYAGLTVLLSPFDTIALLVPFAISMYATTLILRDSLPTKPDLPKFIIGGAAALGLLMLVVARLVSLSPANGASQSEFFLYGLVFGALAVVGYVVGTYMLVSAFIKSK